MLIGARLANLEQLVEHALLALRDTLPPEDNLTKKVNARSGAVRIRDLVALVWQNALTTIVVWCLSPKANSR